MKFAKTDRPKTDLHIFDFDQTMFKSPGPPPGGTKDENKEHWDHSRSLQHPSVPAHPNENWYVQEVLEAFQRARKNPSNHVVVMTGRKENLRDDVQNLLDHADLKPDELVLKPQPKPGEKAQFTKNYKLREMKRILGENPEVKKVHFWEDRDKHLELFQEEAEKAGYHFVPHLVHYEPPEKQWQTYLDNFWEGGKKMIPNPDPKTREQFPEITLEYAIKKFPRVKDHLQDRFQRWFSMGMPTHKGPGKKNASRIVVLSCWTEGAQHHLAVQVARTWLVKAVRAS